MKNQNLLFLAIVPVIQLAGMAPAVAAPDASGRPSISVTDNPRAVPQIVVSSAATKDGQEQRPVPNWLQQLASLAPLGTLTVAATSASIALYAISQQRRNMREQIARNLFAEFLKKAIDYPHFASPEICAMTTESHMDVVNIEFDSISDFQHAHPEIEKYEWFLSFLVFTLNEIIELRLGRKREKFWHSIVVRNLKYHHTYFQWRYDIEKAKWHGESFDARDVWFLQLGTGFKDVMSDVINL